MKNTQQVLIQVALTVLVLCIAGIREAVAEPKNASICFANPKNILDLSCSKGAMIRINKIIYGLSDSGKCNFTDGDCYVTENTPYSCIGQSRCSINLPSGNYGRYIPRCQQHSTYMQVEYECVPGDWSANICSVPGDRLESQSGYIHSPRYPSIYPSNKDCEVTVVVNPGQRIRLLALDLNIQDANGSDCKDTLYIHDTMRGSTLCGSRQNDVIFTTMANKLTIRFKSEDNSARRKGLWLYYEAFPPMETTQRPTTARSTRIPSTRHTPKNDVILTSTSRTQRKASTDIRPTTNSKLLSSLLPSFATTELKRNQEHLMQKDEMNIPAAAIIGGVLGSLLFILVVLVILLIIKRRRERTPKYTSTLVLSPSHSSTTTIEDNTWNDSRSNHNKLNTLT